jgi:hypothetical protein
MSTSASLEFKNQESIHIANLFKMAPIKGHTAHVKQKFTICAHQPRHVRLLETKFHVSKTHLNNEFPCKVSS